MLVTWSLMSVLRIATMLARTHSELCHQIGTTFNCSHLGWNSFNDSSFPENTTSIDLSSNNITAVHRNMFSSLVNLRSINLEHNSISDIDEEAFDGLVNLEAISLSNNNIKDVPQHLIFTNVNVTQLYLKNNTIIIPRYGPLLVSKSLELLNLEWCDIDKLVSADVFSELPQLQKLELNGNSLGNVNATPFQPLIKRKIEVIRKDDNTCSDSLRRTILQLQEQINFTTNCKISVTTAPISKLETILQLQDQINFKAKHEISITTASTTKLGTTSGMIQLPFDVTWLIAATTFTTCILFILLGVYMCFGHCSINFERGWERKHECPCVIMENSRSLEEVALEVLQQVQDPCDNGGYEQPKPKTEEDIIRNLPNISTYIRIVDDNTPIQSPEVHTKDDNFSNNINQFEDHNSSMSIETLAPEIGFKSAQSRQFQGEKHRYKLIRNCYSISPITNTSANETGALSVDRGRVPRAACSRLHLKTENEDLQWKKQTLLLALKTKMDSIGRPERFQDDGGAKNGPLPLLPVRSSKVGPDRRKGKKTGYKRNTLD